MYDSSWVHSILSRGHEEQRIGRHDKSPRLHRHVAFYPAVIILAWGHEPAVNPKREGVPSVYEHWGVKHRVSYRGYVVYAEEKLL